MAVIFDSDTEANLHTVDSQLSASGRKLICWGGLGSIEAPQKAPGQPRLSFSTPPLVVDYDLLLSLPYQGPEFAELRKGGLRLKWLRYPRGIKFTDVFGYIYTSGTTGLPKAAKVTHARMYGLGGVGRLLGLGPGAVNEGVRRALARRRALHLPAAVSHRGRGLGRDDLPLARA